MSARSDAVYTPAEHRVISSWLGVEPLERVDPKLTLARAIRSLGVRPPAQEGKRKIDAAIARIVLARFESRLPVWRGEGLPKAFRERLRMPPRGLIATKDRRVLIAPRLVCAINWVFSGPGIPWPSWYHVSFLPLYNRFVVTESQDSDENDGYYDFALGHFRADEDLAIGCERIVEASWRKAFWEQGQDEWLSFDKAGVVSSHRARVLRGIIWRRQAERVASLEAELEDCVELRRRTHPELMEALVDHAKTAWVEKFDAHGQRLREIFKYVEATFNAIRKLPVGTHDDRSRPIRKFVDAPAEAVLAAIASVGSEYWQLVERERSIASELKELLRPQREARARQKRSHQNQARTERNTRKPFEDLVEAADWERNSGSRDWGQARALKRKAIIEYAIRYYHEHGCMPSGQHELPLINGTLSVHFK